MLMLSKKKLTFSLTSFIALIAFGLVIYAPSVMADGDTHDFGVAISPAENMIDVSSDDGMQIASGRDRSDARALASGTTVSLLITTNEIVHLARPGANLTERAGPLDVTDLIIDAYGAKGRALGIIKLVEFDEAGEVITIAGGTDPVVTLSHRDPNNPGKEFLATINAEALADAYTAQRAGGTPFEIHTLLVSIPKAALNQADIAHVTAMRNDAHEQHTSAAVAVYRVDLVDDDEGDAMYNVGVSDVEVGDSDGTAGTPGVVAIQTLRERAGFLETGAFDVRIILTEEPTGGLTTDLINVVNGSATAVAKGASLKGAHAEVDAILATDSTAGRSARSAQLSELTTDVVSYTQATGTDVGDAAVDAEDLPQATGRDNQYHQYFATITPTPAFNGYVTISVKQFSDKVIPVPRMYTPLSPQQVVATTLDADDDGERDVRDARVANELLMVEVAAVADTLVAAATAAYKTRQEDILDLLPNEITLTNKLVIPAGGYAVLTADIVKAGIVASAANLKDKVTAASKLYNTTGLGLQLEAADLDTFFRNGGTLTLGYADITAATGSGHDDSKAQDKLKDGETHPDYTGYDGATTVAHAAGAVIINEIMWGLDGGADPVTGGQYIELHNPGTADVTIDNLEWVISVGSLPTGYAAIDTVSNNPASGYWVPPGNSGVTAISDLYPTVIDLVSMSRVTGGTDGTAAASWAASIRPSANLGGRRVGTPGAANAYVMPEMMDEDDEDDEPITPVAEADDIMISEIMVASDNGRLPQWIELANVSGAAVSLSGWSLEIDNDSADAKVVGAGDSIVIDLGDVEIGAGEVALVVSKESARNSGVGVGDGDLRADRIIDVQSDVSPDNARYSLISEMGFMLSLIPPQTGAVRRPGDVVGNLDGGWELPMSEDGRSSLIRREADKDAMATMGTDAAGWVLASDTNLGGAYRVTYYGNADDMGTPGYDAGGALPVELSGFNAARDRVTGAVVITWSTQSELNNAGFFIKRSQQTNGKFVIVNPTMISGAGTTAEKQSYTYTDATADPNVIYYYQIEDVSLDGNRQTLTRAHRLKGHIGAAGKATTTWGELKSSRE